MAENLHVPEVWQAYREYAFGAPDTAKAKSFAEEERLRQAWKDTLHPSTVAYLRL